MDVFTEVDVELIRTNKHDVAVYSYQGTIPKLISVACTVIDHSISCNN